MPRSAYPSHKLPSELPSAKATIRDWHRATKAFRRIDATVERDDEDSTYTGDVTWAGDVNGNTVAVAWKWREVLPNIVALSDPMAIESNIVLLDDEGRVLPQPKRILYLNAVVSRLRWQSEFSKLSTNQPRSHATA